MAAIWYRNAAENGHGHASAQFRLGQMYANGEGVKLDKEKADALIRKSAEQGNVDAEFQMGLKSNANKDGAEAVKWYGKAAIHENPAAELMLAMLYEFGDIVKEDQREAVKWYSKAAERGVTEAQARLGIAYMFGRGVERDDEKSLELFRKSASHGHEGAQSSLGIMYEFGRGVAQDYEQALIWYRKGADKGDEKAKANVDRINSARTLRKTLKVGDETHCGLVVEVKSPIVKIQTKIGEHWIKIEQVYPPNSMSCDFANGAYKDPF
ncbi:MAG: sel1 repeat family protein [Gammaproteobacteria bacterium]|nr:sel1 repeat family protein [Gammaproteobacteria bacterium]